MTEPLPKELHTDVLIVGTGPAGSAAAALLAAYGVDAMVINKFGWTSRTPRAHITNQRTMEVLRDLGLEDEAMALASPRELMGQNTYCTSLAGQELGRIRTWGTHPRRTADHELSSPTRMCDLPQNLLEPILLGAAARGGSRVRFNAEYVSHEQDAEVVTTSLVDTLTGATTVVRSKYLLGADGANSQVATVAGLPIEGRMGVSGSLNIVFDADLSELVAHRPSVLYWIIQPGSDRGGLGIGVVRMVRPWHRWLAIWNYDLADGAPQLDDAEAARIVRSMVGVEDLDVRIEATSAWTVNDAYATSLSDGRVFCLGDAVHRHPPTNGLGSNVSIGDAYNLAWKLAAVLRGEADPALLETYDEERAPIARQTVARANKSLDDFPPILAALGLLDTNDPEQMQRNMAALVGTDEGSAERREALRAAIGSTHYVYNTHGVEMNQRYDSGAVYSDGTAEPEWLRDPELYFQASSRPGAPLPHAWVEQEGRAVSTHDLCGGGRFTLLTGNTGTGWRAAAVEAEGRLGVGVDVVQIGPGMPVEDPFGDFAEVREAEESGALLIRPDRFVGARFQRYDASALAALIDALAAVLGRTATNEQDTDRTENMEAVR